MLELVTNYYTLFIYFEIFKLIHVYDENKFALYTRNELSQSGFKLRKFVKL